MHWTKSWLYGVFAAALLLAIPVAWADDPSVCAICGGDLSDVIYMLTDHVSGKQVPVCATCARWPDKCFVCGLPVRNNFTHLPDGRFLCARDAADAILDNEEALKVSDQVRDDLDRLFSRFMTFPQTNVDVAMIDRISLLAFKVPGNDFQCPNVLGYILPRTNHGSTRYSVKLMSALPRAQFRATVAHEYAHAWVFNNVSPARLKTLDPDAHEGFCELVSYLLMESENEQVELNTILKNTYTRGQFRALLEAERQYGVNDVLDWVKFGSAGRLSADKPAEIRNVKLPSSQSPTFPIAKTSAPPVEPDHLVLRGLFASASRPLALINDQTLEAGETARVHLRTTSVLVHCLEIGASRARVEILPSGQQLELHLKTDDR